MKIAYNWLKEFLNTDWEAEKTGDLLTELGLEVEGIHPFESVKGGLKGVVIGKVLTCEKHPNADKLSITTVDLGDGKPVQIVCGAPNVAAGQTVPVATIGTELFDKEGKSFVIKKGNIRGEESHGMICAEDELGLGESHDGIMVLDGKLKLGKPVGELFDISVDEVFEIGLTPNRADAMSHYGVARDLKAGLMQRGINLELITPSVIDFKVDDTTMKIPVDVLNKSLAPRYTGVSISNITVKESPKWLQNRLKSIGINPKNNIVDITNFVLHELGQPLHAFDADQIKGHKVLVKTLPTGTKFTTLDGVERTLHEEDIMICDAESNPMCMGGVFGGLHSGVTDNTKNIFLESAYFNPVAIRKTSKRHALNTDASFRFERGIDVNLTKYALKRAAMLIVELADGKITSDIQEYYPEKIEDFPVVVNYSNINRLIGQEISKDVIKNILASLDIKVQSETDQILGLLVPSYRVDVQREADIIEEIIRIYGYNNIDFSYKLNTSLSYTEFEKDKYENILAQQLVSQGFYENMSNSLTKPEYAGLTEHLNKDHSVLMLNPLSSDLEAMRQSMLFSSLENVAYNLNRQQNNIRFFEYGKTYHKYNSGFTETKHLSLIVSGKQFENQWQLSEQAFDFFYLKGVVTGLLQKIGMQALVSKPAKSDIFSEGIGLYHQNKLVVELGLVRKNLAKEFGVKQDVCYADVDLQVLFDFVQKYEMKVQELPKYPSVRRDLALLVDQKITFGELYHAAFQSEKNLLKEVDLFDVYEGKNLPEGKKSYALSFILRNDAQTLHDKQIEVTMGKLLQSFQNQFGAELRN
ncbi:MAG: phenylalanine--tRNA ligase subunit beta [Flavobacteriaceae bacterium]|nr:phenylalanine--tRNA ligase subunit beta [Flavobacteriaceae bacterium]